MVSPVGTVCRISEDVTSLSLSVTLRSSIDTAPGLIVNSTVSPPIAVVAIGETVTPFTSLVAVSVYYIPLTE